MHIQRRAQSLMVFRQFEVSEVRNICTFSTNREVKAIMMNNKQQHGRLRDGNLLITKVWLMLLNHTINERKSILRLIKSRMLSVNTAHR